jgi:hypothetical protein
MFKRRIFSILILTSIAGILVFLSFNRHSKSGYYNYHSEIWADKAGYYMYLPAALKYEFRADKFPKEIDKTTGYGFKLNYERNTVETKYTYGVALLQLPWYLIADALALPLGHSGDGFSPVYHWSINMSAITYLLLGLFCLWKYLRKRYKIHTATVTVISILLGSHLFYYGLDETGMSHVYSFAVFSGLLLLLDHSNHLTKTNNRQLLLAGVLAGIAVIIRPTAILYLVAVFFINSINLKDVRTHLSMLIRPRILFTIVGILIAVLPQLFYWKYVTGYWIAYSYGDESFKWSQPEILQHLFAPNNGLFIYTPLFAVILIGIIVMIRNNYPNGIVLLLLFVTITYVFSSWWLPSYGCSFGARNYIEYLAVFTIPLAWIIDYAKSHLYGRILIYMAIATAVLINLKLTYSYDGCFHGKGNWDWQEYKITLIGPTK